MFRMEEQTTSGGADSWANVAQLCPMGRLGNLGPHAESDRSSAWVLKADPLKGVESRRGH